MRSVRVLGVIPARLGSVRLPRKPLHPLAGRPLIEWVWKRVRSFDLFDQLVIATDSNEIADIARAFGAQVALTSAAHPTGTDRVAEVAAQPQFADYDVIVNVQGDEPFIEREPIEKAAGLIREGWPIATAATPVQTLAAWHDPAVVKVTRDVKGGALYFSRAPIPHSREGDPTAEQLAGDQYLRHLGVYAYAPEALQRWVALSEHPLERLERLEQLRPLAAGIQIGVAIVASTSEGVDTPEDAQRAEQRIRADAAMGLLHIPLLDLQQHIKQELLKTPFLRLEP
jgi:3-deoxy-manno-octulosonate cytidylyltransferase (CMP-KDO synthetase)